MILFDISGTPGSGKSTAAADLFTAFKKAGFQTELVGEAARDFIYQQGKQPLYDNQFLVSALQWERVYRLHRCGIEIAISDSPLLQGSLYTAHLPYHEELRTLLRKCHTQFNTYSVFIRRTAPYIPENRNQTEAEADAMVPVIRDLVGSFWLEVDGNETGLTILRSAALNVGTSLKNAGLL